MSVSTLVQGLYEKGHLVEPEAVEFLELNAQNILPHLHELDPAATPIITTAVLKEITEGSRRADEEEMKIFYSYDENFEIKGKVKDFLLYFTDRYQKVSSILRGRPGLDGVTAIKNAASLKKEDLSLIGMVSDFKETKAGHYIVELEDQTGKAKIIFTKGSEGHKLASELVYDEIIGISGRTHQDVVFAKTLMYPEIPHTTWPTQDFSIALISDTHIGSKEFMEDEFNKFIDWLGGSNPLASTIKYLLIAGDLVDGCGVYKDQKEDLSIENIQEQYSRFAQLISRIPQRITIIICPGNHDATREAEPQPPIPKEFAAQLYELPNVVMVSSPSYVKLGGLLVLMHHGTSLDSIINSLPSLRKIGYDEPEKAMKVLLRKRHTCPIYGEATRIFSEQQDHLVISKVPNIFHMGHVHSIGAENYRGVRIVNSGTFQARTAFQAKIGHHPTPAIVPIITGNGNVKMVNFNTEKKGQSSKLFIVAPYKILW